MSDEENRRLRRVTKELERRGLSLGFTETSPGKWRAEAWSTSLANPPAASSATATGDSRLQAAEQLLAVLDEENR
jgi:transposase-like protein